MIEKRPELDNTYPFPDRLRNFVGRNSRGFDPYHHESFLDVRVNSMRDGNVCLSVVLPETMTRGFVTFLEAMLGLMKTADRQALAAVRESRPIDLEERQRVETFKENFNNLVCSTFETLIGQGIEKKEAIKQTNALLKAKKHPWANHETVRSILSAEGRLRVKRKSSKSTK
jgi:hypothetical protein